MNAYRRVILGTLVLSVLIALSVPLLSDFGAPALFSVVLVVEALADIAATLYILHLMLGDARRPRSWLLLFLFTATLLVTIGIVAIGTLVVLRFAGYQPAPGGLSLLLTGMGLVLAGAVPIMTAILFWLVGRDPRTAPRLERKP